MSVFNKAITIWTFEEAIDHLLIDTGAAYIKMPFGDNIIYYISDKSGMSYILQLHLSSAGQYYIVPFVGSNAGPKEDESA